MSFLHGTQSVTSLCFVMGKYYFSSRVGVLRISDGVHAVAATQQPAAQLPTSKALADYQRMNIRNVLMILKVRTPLAEGSG
jgi:sulfur relay (sulfurtransferase) DsrF/TusC family protein